MSKIVELIRQLCPDGVEFKELDEVCLSISAGGDLPENYMKGQQFPTDEFPYPIYSNGTESNALYGYTDNYKINSDAVTISARGTIGYHTVRKSKFTPIVRLITLLPNSSIIIAKFLNYALDITPIGSSGGSIPQLTVPNVKKISIPIPPLEIQEDIVKTLDLFVELEAELKAELETRKRQFAFYSDALYRFEGKNVEWKTLGEIGEFTRGKRFVKADIVSEGIPCIHYGEMYTHYKIWAKESKSFLEPSLAARLRVAKHGDVIIVAAGETIEDIGQGVAWLGESDVVIHDACFAFSHNMHPNYVSHFLQTKLFHSQIKRYISSGKISAINAAGLSKAKIPVPSIEEQKRVAAILDKFHLLINDISIGIPAEINGRRKQYEYYRNKLLTFKNSSNG
jgi:type I restriction enzyme S subunit